MTTGLITGSPLGTVNSQEELYIEGSPYIFVQDATATPLNNPDQAGYYWGLSGTTLYPVKQLGCVLDVKLAEGVTMNEVRCDTVGVKSTIQKRNYIELTLTIQSMFPLSIAAILMKLSTPTVTTQLEKVGIGAINNNKYYMAYLPKVYDEDTGDYLLFHLHRVQFVDAWSIDMTYGNPWKLTGLKLRAYADDNKPSTQRFGVIVRSDVSALP